MAAHPARRKVIVVGAGMAGLSAAVELQRSGLCDVTVLEATDRAGGRIQTVEGFASRVIELGAQWIHGTEGNPVHELAAKHNLLSEDGEAGGIVTSEDQRETWMFNIEDANNHYQMESGERIPQDIVKEAKRIYATVMERLEKVEAESWDPNMSLCHFLQTGFTKELKRRGIRGNDTKRQHKFWLMFRHFCRMESMDLGCNHLQDVQLMSYCLYEELVGNYYTNLGSKGYQGIINRILEEIPEENIHYGTPVARILFNRHEGDDTSSFVKGTRDNVKGGNAGGVWVKCEDGRTFSGSHVIVTASVGFLKENLETLFEPALPADMEETLRTMQYGTVNKIFLKYSKRFWASEDFGVQTLWEVPSGRDSKEGEVEDYDEEEKAKFYRMLPGFDAEEKNDEDVLIGWTYGRGAEYMETLSDEEVGQRCTEILRKFLDDPSIPEPDKTLCTRWHSNKYQRGAYGAFMPQHATGNEFSIMNKPIYQTTREEGEKIPVLLFAGEAYHHQHHSTTHGAFMSGRDQAKALLEFLSRERPT